MPPLPAMPGTSPQLQHRLSFSLPAGMSAVLGALFPQPPQLSPVPPVSPQLGCVLSLARFAPPPPQLCLGPLYVLPLHSELSSDSHPAAQGSCHKFPFQQKPGQRGFQSNSLLSPTCGRGPQEEGVEQREWERRSSEGLELFLESLRAEEPEPKATMNSRAAAQSSRPQIGKSPGVHRTGSFNGTPLQTPTLCLATSLSTPVSMWPQPNHVPLAWPWGLKPRTSNSLGWGLKRVLRASLVLQWLRICVPMQGTWV